MRWTGRTDRLKESALTAILVAIVLMGPAVAYAGVNVVYPASTKTLNVNQDPPIRFDRGDDYAVAQANNFTAGWAGSNNNASYTINVSGLSGGNLTIDKLVGLTIQDTVPSFNVSISAALSGSFDPANVTYFVMRIWNGTTAPTTNASLGVRCVLNLKAAVDTHTGQNAQGECELPGEVGAQPDERVAHMQIVLELGGDQTTESSTVSIRPQDIALTA